MKVADNIKKLVTHWFKTDRDFESGKQLFMRYGRNLALKTTLNRVGNSKDNYKYLCYELARLADISEASYKNMLDAPIVSEKATAKETSESGNLIRLTIEEMAAQLEVLNLAELTWPEIQKLFSLLDLKVEKRNKANMIAALAQAKIKKLSDTVPSTIKRSIKLREEFPFLKEKTCPGVLKELVADMLTAYDEYIKGHQHLVEGVSQDEIEVITKSVVDNYLENRQIWEELHHFKTTGNLLGNHPIFEWLKRKAEIHAMKEADLVKLRDQLKNNIPRTKKLITDNPDHKETQKREVRVEQFEKELAEVNQLLGINE